jgi:hypothetical protein
MESMIVVLAIGCSTPVPVRGALEWKWVEVLAVAAPTDQKHSFLLLEETSTPFPFSIRATP